MGAYVMKILECHSHTLEAGFSLLEMVVVVAILSLMAVPIAGGLTMGLNSWSVLHEQAEENERIFLAQERLADWIGGAYRFDVSRRSLNGETMLLGSANTMEFSAALAADPSLNGQYRVSLRLNEETIEVGYESGFSYQDGNWVWRPLVEGVERLEFRYMLGLDSSNQIVWTDQWGGTIDTIYLPAAVEVTIIPEGTGAIWPAQFIPLTIGEQAFCRLLADRTCLAGAFVE